MRRTRRAGLWRAAALVVGLLAEPVAAAPDRQDVTTMAPTEIAALQQRLTDAGCYKGPLDGAPSEATKAAVTDCPDQRPQLRIETGMHVAAINRIGVDRACRLAVTGSEDKTVRVWSLPDGALQRTLRLPIGPGHNGMVYAIALSPDGRTAAAGGWDAYAEHHKTTAVTLFDPTTGGAIRRAGVFGDVINHLAFSPDGARLAVGLGEGGIRVLDVATGREIMADKNFFDSSYGVAFAPDGSLYATGYDGFLRRYDRDLKRTAKARTPGAHPYGVAVDPTGASVAVGYDDTPRIDLFDAATLTRIGSADTKDVVANGNLHNVLWTSDGRLAAAGVFPQQVDGRRMHMARTFDAHGRRLGADRAVSTNTIMALQPCGADLAFAAADPSFGLLPAAGLVRTLSRGRTVDMRGKLRTAFTVSDDGMRIAFGLGHGSEQAVVFDLAAGMISDGNAGDLHPADVSGLPVKNWEDGYPKLNGRVLVRRPNEPARSVAVRPDKVGFVIGAAIDIRSFTANGTMRWEQAGPGSAWGVNLARDGALIAVAYDDGTIRWLRWSDGRELLALFVDAPTKRWVIWTPTGYYMASPGGEDLIGWHVNRGWDQAADFFPASKFRDTYFRPDVVERVLDTLDEAEAVKQADAARGGKAAPAGPILDRLPPVLAITSPGEGAQVGGSVKVEYSVRSPSGLPVDAIDVLVDGRPIAATRGLERTPEETAMRTCLVETRGLGRVDGDLKGCRGSITITFPEGAKEIGLIARSGERTSEVARLRLVRAAAAAAGAETKTKPRLYAVIVGVSAYANKDYTLHYPAKDAGDFAAALQNQKGASYSDVEARVLTDAAATHGAIQDGFDWLSKHVTRSDVGVVFMAGHGVLDERGRFYFLAADSDADRLRATAVPRDDISDVLSALAGKALLFLDACHAGAIGLKADKPKIDINGVVNDLTSADHGIVAFAASTGRQLSEENAAWGNGAFTKAVVEGLGLPGQRGRASFSGSDDITTSGLDAYVSHRVTELTAGAQSPVMIRPATVPDFSLAVAR